MVVWLCELILAWSGLDDVGLGDRRFGGPTLDVTVYLHSTWSCAMFC